MDLQLQQQFNFTKIDADIQELKFGLLEELKTNNPEAYKFFLKEINGVEKLKE